MKIPGEFGIVGELEIKMAFVVQWYVSSDCPIKLSNCVVLYIIQCIMKYVIMLYSMDMACIDIIEKLSFA